MCGGRAAGGTKEESATGDERTMAAQRFPKSRVRRDSQSAVSASAGVLHKAMGRSRVRWCCLNGVAKK